jgi:integrase
MTKTLTDRLLRSLKPRAAEYSIMDAVVPALGVRVLPSGAVSFILGARFPGGAHYTRRALGGYGELTLEQARKKAREWLELIGRGVDPQIQIERQRQAQARQRANTFAAVAEQFIERHVRKTRKAAVVERELRREFIACWASRPITDINQHDVVAVLDEAVERGAPYQAHNLFGHVRTLFNWAIARGIYGLDRSPCDRMRPAAVIGRKLARQRVLDERELRAFWGATNRIGYPYGPLFRMLALTGQRKSEAAEARWCEIDLARKLWTIPPERMKANAAHVVPLSDDVITLLEALPRFTKGDYLFSTTAGAKAVNGFSKVKQRLDREMAVELKTAPRPFVIHDIRRTMRTGLSALPVPDLVRELVIAHTRPGLHKVYDQHAYLDEKRHALAAWAARLRQIIEPPPGNVLPLRKVT